MTGEAAKKKPINSRAKGIRAERELKNMLKESFPEHAELLKRNQDQNAFGGHDLIGLPGFAPECKAVEQFLINGFWKQTVDQAAKTGELPVLFRKVPLKGWEVYLHLSHLNPVRFGNADVADPEFVARLTYPAFVAFARLHWSANAA